MRTALDPNNDCTMTVQVTLSSGDMEREKGLEPSTFCLEGRMLYALYQYQASFGVCMRKTLPS